ncbi:unnamed protein product [Vitrella brassicaformis CCMP3155]|uniref:Uncharacterized protein n=1 Tax=Vitrella brassicaformis (strain CCMP3155) TaxID=1169540 RepID=A0A0G4EIS3_VITBC|nr:unnamed protein product [Vitrella brassicaformis CCMP3155]|eukprot:CEL95802.1 unnamed protein product [Vitrella brassicaformis CCMP3155]
MPKKMIHMTITITKCDIIRLRRHHRWTTGHSPYVTVAIRSNNDMKFLLLTADRVYALVHYLTNYSSKMDIKLHDLVSIVAVGCKKYLERYANTEEAIKQHRLFITGITNSFNARVQMSACQVMWHLLGYGDDGDYYMSHLTYPLPSLPFLKLLAAEERQGGSQRTM